MDGKLDSRRYRRAEVEAVLARALELDREPTDGAGISEARLRELAAELGVSGAAVAASIAEHRVGVSRAPGIAVDVFGPAGVAVTRTLPSPPDRAAGRLGWELQRRELDHDSGSGRVTTWAQRRGWWPDLHRITAVTRIAATVADHPDGCIVRLEARLDPARRSHLRLAGLSMAACLLLPAAVPLSLLAPAVAAAVAGGPFFAAVSYRRRARLVEDRLDGLLLAIAA